MRVLVVVSHVMFALCFSSAIQKMVLFFSKMKFAELIKHMINNQQTLNGVSLLLDCEQMS